MNYLTGDDAPTPQEFESERCEVPSNCLVIPCRDNMEVHFEAEAAKAQGGKYEVWMSLYSDGKVVSSGSAKVDTLDQFTIRGLAIGYAEGWDVGPRYEVSPAAREFLALEFYRMARPGQGRTVADLEAIWAALPDDQKKSYLDQADAVVSQMSIRT